MDIKDLKSKIEDKSIYSNPIVFHIQDIDFIAKQYISQISIIKGLDIVYIENLDYTANLFDIEEDSIQVYVCDTFTIVPELLEKKYTYIICKNISNIEEYKEIVVDVPKLEKWQIIDYANSRCNGVNSNDLQQILDDCNYNIYRVDNELSKLYIFDKDKQQFIFNMMLEDSSLIDTSKYKIFDFSNAIIKRDIQTVAAVFEKISSIDIEPIGLLTILVNQFRNIISIQLANNPTPESTGLKPNQFWAIKHSCGLYTKEQLVNIYLFLTDIDRKIKIGDMPMNNLIDYLVVKLMSF